MTWLFSKAFVSHFEQGMSWDNYGKRIDQWSCAKKNKWEGQ